jgi:hypothetical protein
MKKAEEQWKARLAKIREAIADLRFEHKHEGKEHKHEGKVKGKVIIVVFVFVNC